MLLNAFTVFHVVLSLIGIGGGIVAIYALIKSRTLPGWAELFLATTAATSVTGFFFPFHGFTPALCEPRVASLPAPLEANPRNYRRDRALFQRVTPALRRSATEGQVDRRPVINNPH